VAKGEGHTLPGNVILPSELQPTPKYDPCRLFKKGDVVKIRSVFGRKIYIDDVLYEVVWDESCNKISIKKLTSDETLVGMPSVFFELVTPVEELEPYTLEEETAYIDDEECGMLHIYYNYNGGRDKVRTFYENGPESWNATKAAAEAECARLNDEHRKE
jgi:signal peptidase I